MRQSLSLVSPEARTDDREHRRAGPQERGPFVERIAGWSARHRKVTVLGWLVLVVLVFTVGHMSGSSSVPSNDPGQSGVAEATLQRLHVSPPPTEAVLIQPRAKSLTHQTDAQMRQATAQVMSALRRLPASTASDIRSQVSADGKSALVTFNVTGSNEDQAVLPALHTVQAAQARHPGLLIAEAGGASVDRIANSVISDDFHKAEFISLPITLVLLLIVFGGLVAAGIPLLLAGTAVITAISLTSVIGHWLPTGENTSEVVLVIGMAVGVDYSLFYIRREREERARGRSTRDALAIAARTSGRAIAVSGLTVMIALAGMFLTGYSVFTGIGLGTIAVVGVSVLGSLTFLPALLSLLGPGADRGKIPFLGRRRTASKPSKLWAALVTRVVRRPAAWGAIAAIAMLALAAPALSLRLGNPPNGGLGLPASLPIIKTADQIQAAFPQQPSPAQVVVTGNHLAGPAMRSALTALAHTASAHGAIRTPVTSALAAHGRALLINVPLAGTGTSRASNNALLDLRDQVLPSTLGKVKGITWAVTGNTANNYDDLAALHDRTPIVLVVIAVLAFLLLLVAFRSAAVALISVGLNLLSVAAAFGIVTLIFQDGHLQGLLGFTSFSAIVSWVPLFILVFLFGISMDYHVFMLSRIRELRDRGASMNDAIVTGIASSAGVVSSAAIIMAAVFSILATLSVISLQMLGVGLAAAVLIDATVVRGVLLPAALSLLGERTWRARGSRRPATPMESARPVQPALSSRG